jgi:DNA-binding phage protein
VKTKSKYTPFDPINCLTDEECIEEYILALREEGASEELRENAYLDIERARIVYGIPKREPERAAV